MKFRRPTRDIPITAHQGEPTSLAAYTAEEIQTVCSKTYGVTFPLLKKIDVNGGDRTRSSKFSPMSPTLEATAATSVGTSRRS